MTMFPWIKIGHDNVAAIRRGPQKKFVMIWGLHKDLCVTRNILRELENNKKSTEGNWS